MANLAIVAAKSNLKGQLLIKMHENNRNISTFGPTFQGIKIVCNKRRFRFHEFSPQTVRLTDFIGPVASLTSISMAILVLCCGRLYGGRRSESSNWLISSFRRLLSWQLDCPAE